MRTIDVKAGIAEPVEGAGYPVDTAKLAAEGVRLVVWPDKGDAGPWIEREPFKGRERPADLLDIAKALMAEAEAQHNAPPPAPTLEEARAAKRAEINAAYSAELAAILDAYPDAERLTWDRQEREARRWQEDSTKPTPYLDKLAAARGMALSELVSRIIAKADAWETASATATGKRQALEASIDAAADIATLEKIAW